MRFGRIAAVVLLPSAATLLCQFESGATRAKNYHCIPPIHFPRMSKGWGEWSVLSSESAARSVEYAVACAYRAAVTGGVLGSTAACPVR
jgi:hypothetical protein